MKNFIFYLIIVVSASYISACKSNKKENETKTEEIVPVKVTSVQQKPLEIPIHCSGILTSKSEIKLAFKTGGVIEGIYVQQGAYVRKGQVLAKLNLSEINSQVQQARASLDKANRDLNRVKNLYADTVGTLEQVQNATTGLDVAKANLQIAEFNQRYATIVAPANGRILKRLAEPNEIITSGNPVFVLSSSDDSWIITAGLSDRDIIRIKEGDKANLTLDAYPEDVFQASVTEIDQTTNKGSGTYEVELTLNPAGKKMLSGFIAKGEINPEIQPNSLVIPIEALTEADGEKGYVFVLNPDEKTVKKAEIKIATIYKNEVSVSKGLEPGNIIIIAGVAYLTPTTLVKVVK